MESPETPAGYPAHGIAAPPDLGYPAGGLHNRAKPVATPTPLPKRPKGRWLVGLMLSGLVTYAGHEVWSTYFRYEAYGTVTGNTIQVAPPWDGSLRYLHVREGDTVRQGELLLSLDSTELRQRHDRTADELRMAQATLEAEAAKLKMQSAFTMDQGRGATTLYLEALAQLEQERARLDELSSKRDRAQQLRRQQALSAEEVEHIAYEQRGQQRKVAKLAEGLEELDRRAKQSDALIKKQTGLAENGSEQLRPLLAKIESLRAERTRLEELLAEGEIRAPAAGVIVKLYHRAGERCKAHEPLLALLEEGSLKVVLYVPQRASASLPVGGEVDLVMDPYPEPLTCKVTRLGDGYETAPETIKRHYAEGQPLLPCTLQPREELARWVAFRLGSVVKLPYRPLARS